MKREYRINEKEIDKICYYYDVFIGSAIPIVIQIRTVTHKRVNAFNVYAGIFQAYRWPKYFKSVCFNAGH